GRDAIKPQRNRLSRRDRIIEPHRNRTITPWVVDMQTAVRCKRQFDSCPFRPSHKHLSLIPSGGGEQKHPLHSLCSRCSAFHLAISSNRSPIRFSRPRSVGS